MKRVILTILFLLPLIVPIVPLLRPEYFVMHDFQHIVRLYLLDVAMRQGQWYPRWVDGLGFGFGYPLFNFYPPLIYYIALIFRFLGFGYVWSIKMMLIVGYVVSYIGMYVLVLQITRRKSAAFLGAVLFLLAPYHSVLVYVRGAFAEFYGYAFIPWVSWGFVRMVQKKSSAFFIISFTLLLLAHPFVSFPFAIYFLLAFILTLFFLPTMHSRVQLTTRTIISGMLALGLSSFYWLPSMIERSFTLVNKILLTQDADFREHYIYFRQLWNSMWGYGGSAGIYSGLSFEIGKVHVVLLCVGVGFVVWALFRKKVTRLHMGVFTIVYSLLILSVYMTNTKSLYLWETFSFLAYLQFPWRMLVFAVFFSSLGSSLWLMFVKKKAAWGISLFGVIIAFSLYAPFYRPAAYISGSDATYLTSEKIHWEVSKTSFEFMYRDVQTKKNGSTTELTLPRNEVPPQLFETNNRNNVIVKQDFFHKKQFQSNFSTTNNTLTLNRSYFPGWHAYIDGKETTIKKVGKVQVMQITVPPGERTITYVFKNTPIRWIGIVISIVSLLCFLYFIQIERRLLTKPGELSNKGKGK